jgi:WD40 repeat protein
VINLLGQKNVQNGVTQVSLSAVTAEYAAPDWILDACVSHVEDEESFAYLVTGHNAVLSLEVTENGSQDYPHGVHLRQLATGVKSVLYSADILALSASHILIAAGTIFGEIIVWSCFPKSRQDGNVDAITSIHHFFTGHEGSIFGVDISAEIAFNEGKPGRLLASCSDDRTIRIWDISDCCCASPSDPSAYSTDGFELRTTGFGSTAGDTSSLESENCVTKEWGHASRIWGVHFLAPVTGHGHLKQLNLVSNGEDATCQLWKIDWEAIASKATGFQLRNITTLYHHSGKHIWSLAVSEGGATSTVVYTGGADGAVRTYSLSCIGQEAVNAAPQIAQDLANKTSDDSATCSYMPKVLVKAANSKVQIESIPKEYAFVAQDCFIVGTLSGAVQLGWIDARSLEENEGKPYIRWETLLFAETLRGNLIVAGLPSKGVAVIGGAEGVIRLYSHRTRNLFELVKLESRPVKLFMFDLGTDDCSRFGFVVTYVLSDLVDLFIVEYAGAAAARVERVGLVVPRTVNVTCVSSVFGGRFLVVGSTAGALALYEIRFTDVSLHPLDCIRRVHGESIVTFMQRITSDHAEGSGTEYLLTCGRDGNYCVHTLQHRVGSAPTVQLRTVHRSSSSFSHDMQGAYFDTITQDLILYGFRKYEFVLWNESTQAELMSFSCGGAHRRWAYYPYSDVCGTGVYLWNQGGSFSAIVMRSVSHRALRAGGHGREVKDMAIANVVLGSAGPLIATGAEDTAVRIFTPAKSSKDGPWGSFQCLRVLNKHQTGLQQVSWSRDGRFLFTSGGMEQFFVWRIRSVPVFGIAVVFEASSPKDNPLSDLRVTSFDMLEIESSGEVDRFLLCLAYSNSTVKVRL